MTLLSPVSVCSSYSRQAVIQVLKDRIDFPLSWFSLAEVVENDEGECDTDLERQNIEELYDYVRHVHQRENQEMTYDVQHKALIPILRPYQSQAVNWMLRREKSRNTSPKGTDLHLHSSAFFFLIFTVVTVFFYRTNSSFSVAGVDLFMWKKAVLQPFHWLVRAELCSS